MSDVISCLQLDKELSSKVIVVKEISVCDSSFVVSCMLANCIKNKNAVLLLSTHSSLQHYQNIGLRMNYNLQNYIDSKYVEFYNLGENIVSNIIMNKNILLEDQFVEFREKILLMREKHDTVNIILDGISHLFDLQYSLREVNSFCDKLIKFVTGYNNSFVIFHCNDASEDDVTHVLSNLLIHKAHTVLEVENLQSGWSADVSGHMTVTHPGRKFENEHLFTMELKPSKYLFKLFDRGVKLFAPGMV